MTDGETEIVRALDRLSERLSVFEAQAHAIAERLTEVRADVYGVAGQPGIKSGLQSISQRCEQWCMTPLRRLVLGILEKVLANGVTAFVIFLLYLWAERAIKIGGSP